jgi:hypothetical protein
METISGLFIFWVVHAVLGAVLSTPILIISESRASLARYELLVFVIPYCVWWSLMLSPLSAGRKGPENLLMPFCISFAMPFLALIRLAIRPKLTKGVYAAIFFTVLCAVGVAVFFLVPLLAG